MKKDILELMDGAELFGREVFLYEVNLRKECTLVFEDAMNKDELDRVLDRTWALFPNVIVEIDRVPVRKDRYLYLLTLKKIDIETIDGSMLE